jgi:hypothetical protein
VEEKERRRRKKTLTRKDVDQARLGEEMEKEEEQARECVKREWRGLSMY